MNFDNKKHKELSEFHKPLQDPFENETVPGPLNLAIKLGAKFPGKQERTRVILTSSF